VLALTQGFAIASATDAAREIREEVGFLRPSRMQQRGDRAHAGELRALAVGNLAVPRRQARLARVAVVRDRLMKAEAAHPHYQPNISACR
jgi:hypothetical protein